MSTPASYTQTQSYKHLLQVAENIIYSSQIDHQIIQKYEQLKRSITKKTLTDKKLPLDIHYQNLLSTYRLLIDNTLKTLHCFQQQLQTDMNRTLYNQQIAQMNDNFVAKLNELQTIIDSSNSKTKLLQKQSLNTLKYEYDQLDSKFENLGLLIEVHKKMHEIILEATKQEQKKINHEQAYKDQINTLSSQLAQVKNVQQFIQLHSITENNYNQFLTASKALKKVLFTQPF